MEDDYREYPMYDSDDNFIGWGPRNNKSSSYDEEEEEDEYSYSGSSSELSRVITSFIKAIIPKEEPKKEVSIAPPVIFLKPGAYLEKTTPQTKSRAKWEDDSDDNYWYNEPEPESESEPEPEPIKPIEPVKEVKKWSNLVAESPIKPPIKPPPVVYNKHNKQPPKNKSQKKYNNYYSDEDEPFEYYDRKGQTVYKY
jgi:hypothetical protein